MLYLYNKKLNMSIQSIINSCEQHWNNYKDDCSGFVKAVATDLGITLTGQADDIVNQIQSGNWSPINDPVEAEKQAENGYLVIAGIKAADYVPPQVNGHVVVVVSGGLVPSGNGQSYPHGYWGQLHGIGKRNQSISYAFNAASIINVVYAAISANNVQNLS